jgi:hypothetical protein
VEEDKMNASDIEFDNKLSKIEKGNLSTNSLKLNATVLSEEWPSITTVLQSSCFTVDTYIQDNATLNDLEVYEILDSKPKPMNLLEENSYKYIDYKDSIWIQGSSDFINKRKVLLSERFKNVFCFSPKTGRKLLDNSSEKDFNSGTISHVAVGGVTLCRWNYITSIKSQVLMNKTSTNVLQELRHILDHTAIGLPFGDSKLSLDKKRKLDEERIYFGTDRIIPGDAKVVIATHCVKQRTTPLIKQYLTNKEMLDAYDIQSCHQDLLLQLQKEKLMATLQRIVKAVPEKVVSKLVNNIKTFLHKTSNQSHSSIKDLNVKSTTKNTPELKWLHYDNESKTNDEKAARADDAVIETSQWNWYLLQSYIPNYHLDRIKSYTAIKEHWYLRKHTKPLFCTGNTPTPNHIQLLEHLRSLITGRFSKNITNSFKDYMKTTYGKDNFLPAVKLYNSHKGNK